MSEIIFEVIKVLVMVAALLIARHAIPYLNELAEDYRMKQILEWAKQGVLAAQQVYEAKTGPERKYVVTNFLKQILTEKNLALSEEQIDTLIEAAVKQMKMEQEKAASGK